MKHLSKYLSFAFFFLISSLFSFAQDPTGRGGAAPKEDSDWQMYLIIGIVVVILVFLGSKFLNKNKK